MFIIYEDTYLLVVNKPSGLVVNRTSTWKGGTLEDELREYLDIEGEGTGGRAGIVHRLDKDTSGLLLVAKEEGVFEDLTEQFKRRETKKIYLGLAYGRVEPREGLINAPIARNPKNRRKMAVVEGGRHSETYFEVRDYFKKDKRDFTFLELSPETGRTHQLRVHLAAFNHPLVGDTIYSGQKRTRKDADLFPRLFLHARFLGFWHPAQDTWVEYEAPLPEELQEVLDELTN